MSDTVMLRLGSVGKLRGEAYRVLFGVLGTLEFENRVGVSQAELARLLGMRPQVVNRAWQVLVEQDLLRRVSLVGPGGVPRQVWFVSPLLAWKGEAKMHGQAVRDWEAAAP